MVLLRQLVLDPAEEAPTLLLALGTTGSAGALGALSCVLKTVHNRVALLRGAVRSLRARADGLGLRRNSGAVNASSDNRLCSLGFRGHTAAGHAISDNRAGLAAFRVVLSRDTGHGRDVSAVEGGLLFGSG